MDKREILSFVEISKTPQGQHFQIEAEGKTNVSAERAMRALWSEKCWEKYIPTIHKLRALRSSPDKKIIFIEASILRLYWLRSVMMAHRPRGNESFQWEFIKGDFAGMKGGITLTPEKGTRVHARATLLRSEIDIPQFIIKFALGFALRQAGWSLRKVMESGTNDSCLTSSS